MPNLNGRGPNNFGPLTGRGLGPCGFGFRRKFSSQQVVLTEAEEKKILEAEKAEIEKRLKELR